jgi:hypothetical protein
VLNDVQPTSRAPASRSNAFHPPVLGPFQRSTVDLGEDEIVVLPQMPGRRQLLLHVGSSVCAQRIDERGGMRERAAPALGVRRLALQRGREASQTPPIRPGRPTAETAAWVLIGSCCSGRRLLPRAPSESGKLRRRSGLSSHVVARGG